MHIPRYVMNVDTSFRNTGAKPGEQVYVLTEVLDSGLKAAWTHFGLEGAAPSTATIKAMLILARNAVLFGDGTDKSIGIGSFREPQHAAPFQAADRRRPIIRGVFLLDKPTPEYAGLLAAVLKFQDARRSTSRTTLDLQRPIPGMLPPPPGAPGPLLGTQAQAEAEGATTGATASQKRSYPGATAHRDEQSSPHKQLKRGDLQPPPHRLPLQDRSAIFNMAQAPMNPKHGQKKKQAVKVARPKKTFGQRWVAGEYVFVLASGVDTSGGFKLCVLFHAHDCIQLAHVLVFSNLWQLSEGIGWARSAVFMSRPSRSPSPPTRLQRRQSEIVLNSSEAYLSWSTAGTTSSSMLPRTHLGPSAVSLWKVMAVSLPTSSISCLRSMDKLAEKRWIPTMSRWFHAMKERR